MTSSPSNHDEGFFEIDEKSNAVANFVSLVGAQIQEAFLHRKEHDGLTQQALAAALNVDRSRINRCLSGYNNLTLESVAELVWALRGSPLFTIQLDDEASIGCNNFTEARRFQNSVTTTSPSTPNQIVRTPQAGTHFNRVELVD